MTSTITRMGKLLETLNGRVAGGVLAAALLATVGTGAAVLVTSANAETAPVETPAPAMTIDLTETTVNGLATEQETEAAAAEAERIAAEQAAAAEAARVAAEQAAQAEAERIAAEQAAAAEPMYDEPTYDPAPEAPPVDYCPDGYIDDPNLGCHSPICAVLEDGTQVPCQT